MFNFVKNVKKYFFIWKDFQSFSKNMKFDKAKSRKSFKKSTKRISINYL